MTRCLYFIIVESMRIGTTCKSTLRRSDNNKVQVYFFVLPSVSRIVRKAHVIFVCIGMLDIKKSIYKSFLLTHVRIKFVMKNFFNFKC